MTSVAEGVRYRVPDAPTIGRSLRMAAVDFYFNSWRLVPANVLWGAVLLLSVALVPWPWPLLLLPTLLCFPVAGMYRLAALIQRERSVSLWDAFDGMRRFAGPALLIGVVSTVVVVVLLTNIGLGMRIGGVAGGVFAVFAGYGLVALAVVLSAAWPVIVDPLREGQPLGSRLRLALLVIATRPARMLALTLVIGLLLAVSTVLFAALVTIAIAYVALVATRYVLPAADRLEGRATVALPG